MTSSQIGTDHLIFVALTAGHIIPDGDDALLVRTNVWNEAESCIATARSVRGDGANISPVLPETSRDVVRSLVRVEKSKKDALLLISGEAHEAVDRHS